MIRLELARQNNNAQLSVVYYSMVSFFLSKFKGICAIELP